MFFISKFLLSFIISTLNGGSLTLVDKFTYLKSSVSSTQNDINMHLAKAWTAIDRLSIIRKSDLSNKIKSKFFQEAVESILPYGCTTYMLTKHVEKRLDGNYTRMLWTILKKSWKQHLTKEQLYSHQPAISKTIQIRQTIHVQHCWRSKDEPMSNILLWTLSMNVQVLDDQLDFIYNSSVQT